MKQPAPAGPAAARWRELVLVHPGQRRAGPGTRGFCRSRQRRKQNHSPLPRPSLAIYRSRSPPIANGAQMAWIAYRVRLPG